MSSSPMPSYSTDDEEYWVDTAIRQGERNGLFNTDEPVPPPPSHAKKPLNIAVQQALHQASDQAIQQALQRKPSPFSLPPIATLGLPGLGLPGHIIFKQSIPTIDNRPPLEIGALPPRVLPPLIYPPTLLEEWDWNIMPSSPPDNLSEDFYPNSIESPPNSLLGTSLAPESPNFDSDMPVQSIEQDWGLEQSQYTYPIAHLSPLPPSSDYVDYANDPEILAFIAQLSCPLPWEEDLDVKFDPEYLLSLPTPILSPVPSPFEDKKEEIVETQGIEGNKTSDQQVVNRLQFLRAATV